MRWPLRNQILLPMTCLMAATLAVVSSVDAFLAGRQAKRDIESTLADVGDTLADANYPLTSAVLRQMRGFSGTDFALVGDDNRLLAASRIYEGTPWQSNPPPATDGQSLDNIALLDGERYFHVTVPINDQSGPNRSALLHMFYPQRSYDIAWRLAVFPPIVVGGVALLLVMISGAMIAARVARPLDRLRHQMNRIAAGDFRAVAVPDRNDEVADLSRTVNEMAAMLQRYEENVRRSEQLRTLGKLGGGIAHQIRNSLTGCRMALDLHRRECATADDESLEVARQQLELMEEYIGRFLALGRPNNESPELFNLCDAAERAILLVSPMARHAHIPLQTDLPSEPLMALGSLTDVSQLIVNLLLNAVEAALSVPEGTAERKVQVAVASTVDSLQIEVRDSGPGPSAEIAEQLFEPLISNKRDGVGLGLSVAKSVAEHHQGMLTWERVDGMTCFRVEMPRQAGEAV